MVGLTRAIIAQPAENAERDEKLIPPTPAATVTKTKNEPVAPDGAVATPGAEDKTLPALESTRASAPQTPEAGAAPAATKESATNKAPADPQNYQPPTNATPENNAAMPGKTDFAQVRWNKPWTWQPLWVAWRDPDTFRQWLRESLYAAQFEYMYGGAGVESTVRSESGEKKVAAGSATQSGYRLALNRPKFTTGGFVRLTPTFFSQDIAIHDFRREIPLRRVPGKTDLPTVVTEFQSGRKVDPLDPNTFSIHMRTSGAELQAGGSREFRLPRRFAATVDFCAGIMLAEHRYTAVDLGNGAVSDNSFGWLDGWRIGLGSGLFTPDRRFALQLAWFYQAYKDVRFPRPMEFRDAAVVFNDDTQSFQRRRVYVGGYNLNHNTARLSVYYLFY